MRPQVWYDQIYIPSLYKSICVLILMIKVVKAVTPCSKARLATFEDLFRSPPMPVARATMSIELEAVHVNIVPLLRLTLDCCH